MQKVEREVDKDAQRAKHLFMEVAPGLEFLIDPENLPKVIQIKTPTREFISTRRVDPPELQDHMLRVFQSPDRKPINTVYFTSIPTNLIEEGQILIFDRPGSHEMRCTNPQVEAEIKQKIGDKLNDHYGRTWFAMMGEAPELFKTEDWKPWFMRITFITKIKGKYYMADFLGNVESNGNHWVTGITRIKPTKDSKIQFYSHGYFQSEQDQYACQFYFRRWGTLWVLTEGSSEKGKRVVDQKLRVLKPAPFKVKY